MCYAHKNYAVARPISIYSFINTLYVVLNWDINSIRLIQLVAGHTNNNIGIWEEHNIPYTMNPIWHDSHNYKNCNYKQNVMTMQLKLRCTLHEGTHTTLYATWAHRVQGGNGLPLGVAGLPPRGKNSNACWKVWDGSFRVEYAFLVYVVYGTKPPTWVELLQFWNRST